MSKEYSGTTMAASGSGLRGTAWLQNDIYGSEEHNDTVGQVASGSGRIGSPLNQRSTRGAHGASIALNRSQRRRDNPSASPIRGIFTPAPPAPLSGTAPLQFTENLFTMDEEHFGAWVKSKSPPDCVRKAIDDEPMSGSEFKVQVVIDDKLHPNAVEHLMDIWPGVTRKFCGKLLVGIEKILKIEKEREAGSKLMSARDLAAITFMALPAGRAEGGKLEHDQLKHYFLTIISKIDELQEFQAYAEGLRWFMQDPDPDRAMRMIRKSFNPRERQLDRHLGSKLLESASKPYLTQIVGKELHLFEGRVSGLLTLVELADSMTRLTMHRMGSLLEIMFQSTKTSVIKYSDLEKTYNKYVEARTTLQRMDIHMPSEVNCYLLQQMVQVLANRREMQVTLGIPMAQLTVDGFGQPEEMEAIICDTITEINNSPGKYKDPQVVQNKRPGSANPVAQLTFPAPRPVDQFVCVPHRESSLGDEKCVKQNCKRQHITPTRVCTHKLYKQYGRCPGYFKHCKATHPFTKEHVDKWGTKSAAYDAMLRAIRENPSLATPIVDTSEVGTINIMEGPRASRGRNRPQRGFALITKAVQDADEELFIKDAVPQEELMAALEDEDFSEDTNATDGSEPIPNPNPLEEWVIDDIVEEIGGTEPITVEPTQLEIAQEEEQTLEGQVRWDSQDEEYEPDYEEESSEYEEAPDSPDRLRIRYANLEHKTIERAGRAYYTTTTIQGKEMVVPRLMFDNGACRHMWGRDMVESGLVHNIREVEPHKVDTASHQIALSMMGDVSIGNHVLMAGYLNPYMGLSLVAQGLMSKHEGWAFDQQDGSMLVETPIDEFEAEMHGALAFWPNYDIIQELHRVQDKVMATVSHQEQEEQSYKGLTPIDFNTSDGSESTDEYELSMGAEAPSNDPHTGGNTETDEEIISEDNRVAAYIQSLRVALPSTADPDSRLMAVYQDALMYNDSDQLRGVRE